MAYNNSMTTSQIATAIYNAILADLPTGVTATLVNGSVRTGVTSINIDTTNEETPSLLLTAGTANLPVFLASETLPGDENGYIGVGDGPSGGASVPGTQLETRDRTNFNLSTFTDTGMGGDALAAEPNGARIDDIVVGLAGRGEMVTTPAGTVTSRKTARINSPSRPTPISFR